MISFKQKLLELIKDEEGLTTVEYAIAGSLVGAAVVVSFTELGTAVGSAVNTMCSAIDPNGTCDGGAAAAAAAAAAGG
mgnify:CR=1 FL=1